jgi:16S rRNA A1518/A1519 N6-dimethyltransferase RsmA/KsgA/DIM1 with predicted DNA glycosylase/AP lyase activity
MIPQLPEWVREREASPIPARQAARPRETPFQPAARFLDFVKCCFAQKRKNLLNNLAGIYSRERAERALAALSLRSTIRAEQLALSQFAGLFERLS